MLCKSPFRFGLAALFLALCAPARAQSHYLVYEIATPGPTREVDLLQQQRLFPVEAPPWGASVHVVGTSETELRLSRLQLTVMAKSSAVPFRWLRPDDVAAPVPLARPAPLIRAQDGYHDRQAVERLLFNWARFHPDRCALYQIGASVHGAPLYALRISDHPTEDEDEPSVLFSSNVHACELLTVEVQLDLIERLVVDYDRDPCVRRWVDECEIWAVPLQNPDGNDCVYNIDYRWRKNARDARGDGRLGAGDGVDLNRNFPVGFGVVARSSADPISGYYHGPAPASEPEVQALMGLAQQERFALAFSYHTAGSWVLYPYSERSLSSPEPNYARDFGEALGARLFVEDSTRPYRVASEMYPVAGVDQDYYYGNFGTFAYIVEVGRKGGQPDLVRWREPILASIRPSWRFALDALTSGPRIWGHVVDATNGQPLEAEIRIQEQALAMQERWTTHPATGRFDRLFASPTTVTLVACRDGYRLEEKRVSVKDGPVRVEFRLHPLDAHELAQ